MITFSEWWGKYHNYLDDDLDDDLVFKVQAMCLAAWNGGKIEAALGGLPPYSKKIVDAIGIEGLNPKGVE